MSHPHERPRATPHATIPILALALACMMALVGCARRSAADLGLMGPPAPAPLTQREVDRLANLLVGSFSSAQQHADDPERYLDIRLHMARIWPQRRDGRWLYVEQATAQRPDRPYRQRVYRLLLDPDDPYAVLSEVYTLPGNALIFAGAWRDPARFAALTPEDLTLRTGCAVSLRPLDADRFEGATRGTGCASDLAGATHATSEVIATPAELRTWDRGWAADGTQAWGATDGPYIFVRTADRATRR